MKKLKLQKYLKCECASVHIKDHVEGIRNTELVINVPRIREAVPVLPGVVEDLHGLETPSPAGGRAAHQPLVPGLGQMTVTCGHANHRVRASQLGWPRDLPHV